jgi:3-dehydroquinate dehydratase-1
VELGRVPRVVAVIDTAIELSRLQALVHAGVSVFEIRADLYAQYASESDIVAYVRNLRNALPVPCIATLRCTSAEQCSHRRGLFSALIDLVEAVDVDISRPDRDAIIDMAYDKTVIVSMHDYEKTPDARALTAFVHQAATAGADIVKIATTAADMQEVTRLLAFTRDMAPQYGIVTMAMGEAGTISRVVSCMFGSLFTYCFAGTRQAAPGQLPAEELTGYMRRFYPGFGASAGMTETKHT